MASLVKIEDDKVCTLMHLYRENFGEMWTTHTGAYLCERFLEREFGYFGFLAVCDGEFAGEVTYRWVLEECVAVEILTLSVLERFRRRGIATLLLNHALSETSNAHHHSLHTETDNIASQALYRKMGFVVTEEIPNFYADEGRDGYLLIRMNPSL